MNLWRAFRLAGWLALLAIPANGDAVAARAPNFVVLLADDQRWDALGVVQRELGARGRFPFFRAATPNLDRIAAEGFRFRDAFVVSSLCSPSRAAFLTGRYGHRNGVVNNHTRFPIASTTYATRLRTAGYRTGYFGKWHMFDQRERPGFDEWASFVDQGTYFDATLLVDSAETPTSGWVDDVTTGYAVDFIRRYADRRFLLVLGFKSPHGPPYPARRLQNLFPALDVAAPPNAASYAPYDPTRVQDANVWLRGYFQTLVGVDQNVGRVLAALDREGIADDTALVYASDNGFLIGEHGVAARKSPDGNKRNAYEESIRIPLLLRYPRLGRRGVALDAQALNIDLAPTLLELAGLPALEGAQGTSWVPLLLGLPAPVRRQYLYEYFYETGWLPPTMVALRRGDYKLIRYPGRPDWRELFDLRVDPFERSNLARLPRYQPVLREMGGALDAEARRVGYRVPPYADPPD